MNPNHDIKCWPEQFAALASGEKNFEYRKNGRGYQVGDVLLIREWNPADHDYTGQTVTRVVGHILREGFGLPGGYAVLGLKPITPPPADLSRGIKPLEWEEPSERTNQCWVARTPFGIYSAVNEGGWYVSLDEHAWRTEGFEWAAPDMRMTLADAQAAARADYERRVFSCLAASEGSADV